MKKFFSLIAVMMIAVIVFACSSEPDRFTLTIDKVGEGEITITPQNEFYEKGAKVTITAVPSDGWKFKEWSGDASDTADSIEVTMDKNKTITGTFVEKAEYTLTTAVSPTDAGNITTNPPTGPYEKGSTVTVTAVAGDNHVFDTWSGDLSGSTNPTSVVMDKDKTITAEFVEKAKYTLTATVSPTDAGNVTLNPPTGPYCSGSTVTVTAVAGNNHVFDSWSGDFSGSTNPTSVVMDKNKAITATFVEAVTLTVDIEGLGFVVVDPKKDVYCKGDVVTLNATPVLNISTFSKWEGGTIDNSTNATETITLNSDVSVRAVFEGGENISFYEDFELNDGSWSTRYAYDLLPANRKPFVQKTEVHSGNWSARFGGISHSADSSFETSVNITKKSYVSFFYKVSSEVKYDKFRFYIDGNVKLEKAGDVLWTKYEVELPSGEHTLKWMYVKDAVTDGGQDTAWVDNIMIRDYVPKHTLTINTTGYGKVVKKVNGEIVHLDRYEEGTQITLEAAPGPNESFTTWGGADAPAGHLTDSTIEITMGTSDMTINASFTGTAPDLEWLIMMYMGGDCNLEPHMWKDLNEMELGLHELSDSVRSKIKIVALWDGVAGYSSVAPEGARLYELGPDSTLDETMSSNTVDKTATKWWTGDEVDMSDGANVTSFLNWAKTNYPSYEHTMFMLSDHGGGGRNRDGKPRGRGVVWDDTTGGFEYFIETKELSQAISAAEFKDDHKLSILGFDACLMASVEEAYEHRTVADYYVASLQTEQGDGWEYYHWIPQIIAGMSPAELGTLLVESYHENFSSYHDSFSDPDQTLSCTDLSKMEDLKTAIDALGKAIKDNNLVADCKTSFEKSTYFGGTWATLYEVGDFVSRLSSTAVAAEASAVADAMKEAIVYSWAASSKGNYCGVGSVTGRGLHLIGEMEEDKRFNYDTTIFSFADGDWATLYNEWYPQP